MSVVYLSFGSIAQLHNNSLLKTSPIGELSNKARTYAKDPGVFSITSSVSATILFNFLSQKDNADIVLPQALAEVQIGIVNWLYAQAVLGNITGNRPNTLALLRAEFTNNVEITDIGEMVTNNTIWLPSFVKGTHTVSGAKHDFYVWLADAYFRDQYPKVSFTVVHPVPIADIDVLVNLNYQDLATRLAKETPDVIEARTKALTSGSEWPYTERNVIGFDVMDLINTGKSNKAYWRYVEWGNGADAEDQLFTQIQNEILAKSKFPRAKWEEVVPDLFNPIEFYVLPYYTRTGLTNKTNGAKSYSPIVDRETMMALADKYLTPNMTSAHVIGSLQVVPFLYKSFSAAFVAKMNNRAEMKKVYNLFADYALIPSGDPEAGQMNAGTLEFIMGMENLLAAAEVVTPISLPPSGVTRIERFGKVYVAKRIGKAKFIVMTRWQMIQDNVVVE